MNYSEFIPNIIDSRGQWNTVVGSYWEGHHILPKCLGGKGSSKAKHSNVIRLTAKEHFIAHKLLADENPTNLDLQWAYWLMCNKVSKNSNRDYNVLAVEFEKAKERVIALSGKSVICIETGAIYRSIREAKLDYPTSGGGISRCCRDKAKTAAGYHWAFTKDTVKVSKLLELYSGQSQISKECRNDKAIICIETQKVFNRLTDAIKQYGMGIATCLAGKSKKAYGYHWAYLDDIVTQNNLSQYVNKDQDLKPSAFRRSIYCVELGLTFDSLKEASIFAKVSSSAIMRCAKGEQKHAGGFTWQYI